MVSDPIADGCGSWELNSGPLEEQLVLLTADSYAKFSSQTIFRTARATESLSKSNKQTNMKEGRKEGRKEGKKEERKDRDQCSVHGGPPLLTVLLSFYGAYWLDTAWEGLFLSGILKNNRPPHDSIRSWPVPG
jgi:hypothetical protein